MHRFLINFILFNGIATGYEQRVDISTYFAKRFIRSDVQSAVGNY